MLAKRGWERHKRRDGEGRPRQRKREREKETRRDGTLVVVIVLALVAIVAASSRGWIVIPHTFIPRLHDERARARVVATAGTSNPLFM